MLSWLRISRCAGSRVTILAFFAASVDGGKNYIYWYVLLIHCVVMLLFFKPQKDLFTGVPITKINPDAASEQQTVQTPLLRNDGSINHQDEDSALPTNLQANNNRILLLNLFILIKKWHSRISMRKYLSAISLMFVQIFAFIPFKEDNKAKTRYAHAYYAVISLSSSYNSRFYRKIMTDCI